MPSDVPSDNFDIIFTSISYKLMFNYSDSFLFTHKTISPVHANELKCINYNQYVYIIHVHLYSKNLQVLKGTDTCFVIKFTPLT